VNFSNHNVEITKRNLAIDVATEIVVSPEDNVEIRCMTLSNLAMRYRQIEITSYVEIALADHKADLIHPAFSKMFIETEAVEECQGLIAHRRQRSPEDPERWCFHLAALNVDSPPFTYETQRDIFIGHNRSLANPEKILDHLTNTKGFVLDPIFALRRKIRLEAGKQARISFITGYASSREEAVKLMQKYKNIDASTRVMEMAWTHAELDLRRLHITHDDAHLFQRLANFMIYPDVQLRASPEILRANRFGQEKLWGYGLSGDNPILLVTIEDMYNLEVVHSALLAHAFWNMRGLKADLVILNKEKTSYEQPLNEHLIKVVQSYAQYTGLNTNGGIFLIEEEKLAREDLNLLLTVAHAILVAERGNLSQQLAMPRRTTSVQSLLKADRRIPEEPSPPLPFLQLLFYNGIGGFTQDGKEYAIFYEHGKTNVAPWINVICNKNFGFLASAHGLGMTWNSNSQMNRLTPWSNDSTLNPITDVCYIRDDESGKFWTVACAPILENDPFRARHGNG
jgi:cyclic beta-1,2-glucan synthetase